MTATDTTTHSRIAAPGVRWAWFWDVPEFRRAMGLILVFALSTFLLLPLLTLLLWAFADEWRYPNVIPQSASLKWWDWVLTNGDVGTAVRYSFITAPVVTLIAAMFQNWATDRFAGIGLMPVASGWLPSVLSAAVSPSCATFTGAPSASVTIPPSCHPPQILECPNGNS